MRTKKCLLLIMSCAVFTGCGSSSNTSAPNPAQQLEAEALSYMASAAPNRSSSALMPADAYEMMTADPSFLNARTGLKRPGRGGGDDVSVSQYLTDVLDPQYNDGEADASAPTVFFRFSQELEILKTLGEQVPWSNGAPTPSEEAYTITLPDGGGNVTAVITEVEDNANFDVKIDIVSLQVKALFKNRDNQANIVSIEEKDGSDFSYTRFFWNKATGALAYDYVTTGTNWEVNRINIASTAGATRILHLFGTDDYTNRLFMFAPNGPDSTEFDVSFQRTLDNTFIANYCASGTTNTAATDVCSGSTNLTDPIAGGIVTQVDDPGPMRVDVFGAADGDFASLTGSDPASILVNLQD